MNNELTSDMLLPMRRGDRPRTRRPTPHQQLEQNAPISLQEELYRRVLELPGVHRGDSAVSVDGARAFLLDRGTARGPRRAFMMTGEFAHLHPDYDGSLHLTLPPEKASEVYEKGWGEPHPLAALWGGTSSVLMVYGPRDREELETVWRIVVASYDFARGERT